MKQLFIIGALLAGILVVSGCYGAIPPSSVPKVVSGEDYQKQCQASYSQCSALCSSQGQNVQSECLRTSDCSGKWLDSERKSCQENCALKAQQTASSCDNQCQTSYQSCISK